MTCKEFPQIMSAQVDGHANESEQLALQAHLRACASCRRYAADLRGLRSELRALEAPRPASSLGLEPAYGGATLRGQIQSAMRREARLVKQETRRKEDLIDLWSMRLCSQGIGTVVSLALFVFVAMEVFKPAYRAMSLTLAAQQVVFGEESTEEFSGDPAIRYRVMILQPPPPPTFNPDEQLLQLGESMPADTEIMAAVRVNNRNGRATLDYVLGQDEQVSDASLLTDRLASAFFQRASFQLPGRDRAISNNAVILFGKVNISAHLD